MAWTWAKPLMAVGAALSVGVGAFSTWRTTHKAAGIPVVVSQRGRDQEVFRLVKSAKRTITVRTENLSMVPLANELAQAQQRGVKVAVYLPLEDGLRDGRLGAALMGVGALVQWKEDPSSGSYKGAYIEVDQERFLYSATPLAPVWPGANVGYVSGPVPK